MPSRSVSEKYDSLTEERKEEIKTNRQQYVIDNDAKIKARKKRFKEAHKEQFVFKTNCVCVVEVINIKTKLDILKLIYI